MIYYSFNDELYFKLYSNCIFVQGIYDSIIIDLHTSKYIKISSKLYPIFELLSKKTTGKIKSYFFNTFDKEIEDLFEKLILLKLGFYTDTPNLFPMIKNEYFSPSIITNVIIDFKYENNLIFKKIFIELNYFLCSAIQIRYFYQVSIKSILELLSYLNNLIINDVQIIMPFKKGIKNDIAKIIKRNLRVSSFILYNSPLNNNYSIYDCDIAYTTKNISNLSCGIINESFFVANLSHFTEAQHHNTCLNRKISIDAEGNIKNCPSMKESFGNIRDTTLAEALEKPGFKKYWNIKKDDITKCKDCEFRYICTDCRAYLEDPDDIYSAPLKCGYDPYTGKWEKWSKNPLNYNIPKST